MKVQKYKRYDTGFVLDEKTLRGLVQVSYEQLFKIKQPSDEIKSEYRITHSNCTISVKDELDDVFLEENSEEVSIISITVKLALGSDNFIYFQYVNPDHEESDDNEFPIFTSIASDERDWAFETDTKLKRIVGKSTRKKRPLPNLGLDMIVPLFVLGLIIGVMMLLNFFSIQSFVSNEPVDFDSSEYVIHELELLVDKDFNAIESLLKYEEIKAGSYGQLLQKREKAHSLNEVSSESLSSSAFIILSIMLGVMLPFLVYVYKQYFLKLYPFYVFNFGEYKETFSRMETNRRNLFWLMPGLIASLLISYFFFMVSK